MAELPERKVLKDILTDLKSKTVSSKSGLLNSIKRVLEALEKLKAEVSKVAEETPSSEGLSAGQTVLMYLTTITGWFQDIVRQNFSTIDDFTLYINALEKYSMELDKTLYDAIEAGKRKAEEQIKEQNELMKRKSDDYVK